MFCSDREKSLCQTHCYSTIGMLVAPNEAHHFSPPATLETVDAGHSFILIVRFRNTPEVVLSCALLPGPAYSLPLQEIVRHQMTVLIIGCTIQIDTLFRHESNKNTREQLPMIFCQ